MSITKYPIGIQTFEIIRTENYLYVDKTRYLYELVSKGEYYFLSRPRRFGKSLMLSTLEALFRGKRHLFKGLAIDSLYTDWQPYEVLHLDLNAREYTKSDSLHTILGRHLDEWEEKYGIAPKNDIAEDRFIAVIKKAFLLSGRRVVILVDEYDKPLISTIGNTELQEKFRSQLQAFFGVLKSLDQYIRFGMLTGVSRFSKVSVFSRLNNLHDISLVGKYNSICGITETELSEYFQKSICEMAEATGTTEEQLHSALKMNYDGYHFSARGEDVYNPFSLLLTFSNQEFGSYWLATGTSSSLLKALDINTYPLQDLENYRCSEKVLSGADIFLSDPVPFFFQTGYLTIKGYDPEFKEYTLGFPNKEVAEGFNDLVLKAWCRDFDPSTLLVDFVKDVRKAKVESFMTKLQSFFADIPYDHSILRKKDYRSPKLYERHYQNVMYVIMKLMGFYTHTEYRTSSGRIDMMVETSDYIYVMEFKIDSTPEKAIEQINQKSYSLPFLHSNKKVFKIGANFDTASRTLSGWVVEEA